MSDDEWVVSMPKLGETVTEGQIGTWLKQVGDSVAFDDPLFEVSTDKVDSEIPSPYDGVIVEILVGSGETVPVGTPLVRIGSVGTVVENRLPSAAHAVAAAGGPGLGDPAAPQMGGSEGMAGEPANVSTPAGEVHEVTMPKLGETVTEGTVSTWLKQVGDSVAFDDPLFEVSTDKVDSEIPSPYDGVLLDVLVAAGETVPVGTPLARIGEPGAAAGGAPPPAPSAGVSAPAAPAAPAAVGGRAGGNGHGVVHSPVVRRLAAEGGVDLATVMGTGVGGRIRREDVEQAIATGGADRAAPAAAATPVAPAAGAGAPVAAPVPAPAALRPAAPWTSATWWSHCRGCDWRLPRG